jgi:membrane-associated phospholipid phosphatase
LCLKHTNKKTPETQMNDNKVLIASARFVSAIFHPLLIPTLGFLFLFNSGFYFSILPWALKKYMLLVIFITTCFLPAMSVFILSINSKFDINMEKNTERTLALIISAVSYYIGYLFLKRIPLFPVYNVLLLGSVLVHVILLPVSMRWKVSIHAAAIGGVLGGILGLALRLQENPVVVLSSLILIAGLVGTARLILSKHTEAQIYSGFSIGFLTLFLIVFFI